MDFTGKLNRAADSLSFDDVLILPRYSEIAPIAVDTKSRFSKNIPLNVPIVSAPMDTTTEHAMAIAMACMGGLGIIHTACPIEAQVNHIVRVKRFLSRMITDPYTLHSNNKVDEARAMMGEKMISGILIVDADGRLTGILTRRNIQFGVSGDAHIGSVMTSRNELVTALIGTTQAQAETILAAKHVEKLPIVDSDFRVRGLITLKDIEKRRQFPNALQDTEGRLRVGAAVGATGDFLERAQALVEAGVDVIVVDSSHGHSINVYRAVQSLKRLPEMMNVVAGNIVTTEAAEFLMGAGADGLRVGIGPGSICSTRIVTAAGRGQLSAIACVADAAAANGIPVIADGGVKHSGDIVKALAAGADSVMIGNLFARTDESPGEVLTDRNDQKYKLYRGMGSKSALRARSASRYATNSKAVPEGVEGRVPYAGMLADVFGELEGGLRQAMGYFGCSTVTELRKNTVFERITHATLVESAPHDIRLD